MNRLQLTSLPIEYSGLFQHVAQIDVGVQKVWVERHSLLEVVDGQPDLALGVEHTAQVGPGNGKVGSGLDSFQITRLERGEAWG